MASSDGRPKVAKSPEELQVGVLFAAACEARDAGELERARDLLRQALALVDDGNRRSLFAVHEMLGFVHRLLKEPEPAVYHAESAVRAAPKSELASLNLFHALLQLGDWERALWEIVRFLELRDSTEYRELLAGGLRDEAPARLWPLVDKARALLVARDAGGTDKS